jgi:Tol biopolymer transport system component
VLEFVDRADWTPDGKEFAILRSVGGHSRIESPIGKVLYTAPVIPLIDIRISPGGDRIAFLEGAERVALVCVLDRDGHRTALTPPLPTQRVAWDPGGREIWYEVRTPGGEGRIESVDLAGHRRTRLRAPTTLILHDIAKDGRLLVERYIGGAGLLALVPGSTRERQLAWFDYSVVADISADGTQLVMTERGQAEGGKPAVYLRKTDGSPAVRIAEGEAQGFSEDGRTVLVRRAEKPGGYLLVPTGTGTPVEIPKAPFSGDGPAWLTPDGKRIVITATLPGKGRHFYVREIPDGPPREISLEGFLASGQAVSPDGKWIAGFRDWSENLFLFPLDGGPPREIPGTPKLDPIHWADDRTLFVAESQTVPFKVYRLDATTGARTFVREVSPPEGENAISVRSGAMTPDGRYYAYSYARAATSDLFLVEGVR